MKNFFLPLIFLIISLQTLALNKDSLWVVYKNKALHDTIRFDAGNELKIMYDSSNPDSALIIASQLFKLAQNMPYESYRAMAAFGLGYSNFTLGKYRESIRNYEEAELSYQKINRKGGIAKCFTNMALAHLRLGEFDQSYLKYLKAKEIYTERKDTSMVGQMFNQLAMVRDYQGRWKESLNLYYQALKIFEDAKDKYGQSVILVNIATMYDQLKDKKKSREILNRSLKLKQEVGDEFGEAIILLSLAEDVSKKNDFKTALDYLFKAQKIFEKFEAKDKISNVYYSMGSIYADKGELLKGLEFFKKGIAIQRELELNTVLASSLSGAGEILIGLKQYAEALKSCEEGLAISKQTGNVSAEKSNCKCLSLAYEKKGDPVKALNYYKAFVKIKDSLINDETTREATRKEMSFGFAKKQLKDSLDFLQQKKFKDLQLSEQAATIKSEKAQKLGLYLGLALVFILGAVSFRSYTIKKKDNKLIAAQKLEVETKKTEIEGQRDLIEKQKHIVDEKQKEIIDSINYAKRIQYALLANENTLTNNLAGHFVLFKPKDIVSGDFYWATEHNNKFYLAVCDCTGHGIPGAFMSLLNIGFLSEAINEKELAEPHLILNYVRKRLIESISQDGQKDGMDALLICLDKKTSTLTYAAANNEPILIKNNQLIELPKDKMPVGKGETDKSFTLHSIAMEKNDRLYLYTDGFADQFGGPKGKKFKYKPLNDLLLETNDIDLQQQKNKLNEMFEQWKGHLEQVDDVLIVGIKI